MIVRPRLEQKLAGIWAAPLGLVIGPAGYGKSTLVRQWMDSRSDRVAWMTVDQADNDPDRFIASFVTLIRELSPSIGANVADLLERPSRPSEIELAETLADELIDLDDDLCIVMDEAENLHAQAHWSFIERLVGLAPEQFHLLLISRIDPPLPLWRLRIRQQLVEVRINDLQFSTSEVQMMLTAHLPSIDPAYSENLQRITHGWAAGIRIASLALLEGGSTADISPAHFDSSRKFVLDALLDEVLASRPGHLIHGLLATAIVDEVSPSLCEALLGEPGNCRKILDESSRAGLFVHQAAVDGDWYRLHPLFRDLFLRQLSVHRTKAEMFQLHLSAAAWFAGDGRVRKAISHFIAGQDVESAVELLSREIPLAIDQEDWTSVAEWLAEIPVDVIDRSPALAIGQCWVLFFREMLLSSRAKRPAIRKLCETIDCSEAQRNEWLAELDVIEASDIPWGMSGPERVIALTDSALKGLNPKRRFPRGHCAFHKAMALEYSGRAGDADEVIRSALVQDELTIDAAYVRPFVARLFILRQRGHLPELESSANELLLLTRQRSLPVAVGWARLFLGWAAFERQDYAAAELRLREMIQDRGRIHLACLSEGKILLARLYRTTGETVEAMAVLRRLREVLANNGATEALNGVAIVEGYLKYLDDPASLATPPVITAADVVAVTPQLLTHPVTMMVVQKCASASPEDRTEALAMATAFEARVRTVHFTVRIPEVLALQAVALASLGSDDQARDRMRQALAHPAARWLPQSFLDLGPDAQKLIHQHENDPDVGAIAKRILPRSETRELKVAPGSPNFAQPSESRSSLMRLLTDRELRVLECLDRRLSYKEIGAELYISPLTVKRHAGNIYDKLGADNRRDAVFRAYEMGWTPRTLP